MSSRGRGMNKLLSDIAGQGARNKCNFSPWESLTWVFIWGGARKRRKLKVERVWWCNLQVQRRRLFGKVALGHRVLFHCCWGQTDPQQSWQSPSLVDATAILTLIWSRCGEKHETLNKQLPQIQRHCISTYVLLMQWTAEASRADVIPHSSSADGPNDGFLEKGCPVEAIPPS